MVSKLCEMQIGKQGITDNFISTLKNNFKKNRTVKIKVLSSARSPEKQGRKDIKEYSNKLIKELGDNYVCRVIGFTITLIKFRKPVR